MKSKVSLRWTAFAATLFLCGEVFAQNQKIIDSLITLLPAQKEDTNKVMLLYAIGSRYRFADPQKTLEYGQQVGTLSRKLQYQKGIGCGYLLSGMGYELEGNYKTAIDSMTAAEKVFNNLNDAKFLSYTYTNLSHTYGETGNYEQAAAYGIKDLQLTQALHDSTGIVDDLLNLCHVYVGTKNKEQALQQANEALSIARKTGDLRGEAMSLMALGNVHNYFEDYPEALDYYQQSLQIRKKMADSVSIERVLSNIGGVYANDGNNTKAVIYLIQAMNLAARLGMDEQYAGCLHSIAMIFMQSGKYDSALHYYNRALEHVRQNGDLETEAETLVGISNTYEKMGDYKNALKFYQMHSDVTDSLLNQTHDAAIAELQTKYETDKKDQQIALLNSQEALKQAQISRQRTALFGSVGGGILLLIIAGIVLFSIQRRRKLDAQIALLEKQNEIESVRNKISLDIHDDIGSGITKINLLLNQFLSKATSGDGAMKEMAEKISARSRDVISGLGEVVWAANPKQDTLHGLIGFMRQYINHFFEDTGIQYEIEFSEDHNEMKIHPELRRNLYLALKESLNNLVKHSGATEAEIIFTSEGKKFHFEIRDNGKGISAEQQSAFSRGMESLKKRIEDIKGDFGFSSEPGKGTVISINGILY